MFRSLAIVLVAGVLISVSAERWRGAGKAPGAVVAPAEAGSLLPEETEELAASVGESEGLEFAPALFDHCQVHRVPLQERWLRKTLAATADAPANVRAAKFPRAPFKLIAKRMVVYERPFRMAYCVHGQLAPPKVFDCPACVEAQKEWFREHPAPEQEVVLIPGEEPSPWGNAFGR